MAGTRFAVAAALSFLVCGSSPAWAARSCALEMVASLDLDPAELPGRAMISAVLNDTPEKMIIDTGAVQTAVTEGIAAQFKLHRSSISQRYRMEDYYGQRIEQVAIIPSLTTGNLRATDVHAFIFPRELTSHAAGVIGPDMLSHYEVELDFASGKLNLFAQDHCPGQLVYWTHDPVAAVPIRIDDFGHIDLDVTLDGKAIPAHLDTGAPLSSMKLRNADSDFGLKPDSPGMQKKDLPVGTIYFYRFKSLAVGGVSISNPTIYMSGGTEKLGEQTKRDFLLGLHELEKLHVIISYKEKMLYASAPDAH
jgi:predicted aspartyl protease